MPHTRILVRFRGARRGVGARAERERAMAASLGTVARWSARIPRGARHGLRGAAAVAGSCLSWKVRSARDRTERTIAIGVRWKFLQNSGIFARKIIKKIQKIRKFSTFSKISAKFRQNFIKIWAEITEKNLKNDDFLQKFAEKCEKVCRIFSEILRSERCKSM